VTQILTPIFHALVECEGVTAPLEPAVTFERDPLAAPLPPAATTPSELPGFDQPTEKRGTLQVVAGREAGGAHRARGASGSTRSYSTRAGFHSRTAQTGGDALGVAGIGAHRAPEDDGAGARGFVVNGAPVSAGRVGESGSHHAVSRTGGRHRTLRAVSH